MFTGLSQRILDEDMKLNVLFKEAAGTSASNMVQLLQEFYSKQAAELENRRFNALVRDPTGEVGIHSFYNRYVVIIDQGSTHVIDY